LARARRGRPVDGSCDVETWKGLAGLGLTGIAIPLTAGGSGGTAVELAVIAEQLGATLAHVPFLESAGFCGALLTAAADSEPAAALLPELASGSTIATFAILEADGAWSTDSITTTARQENGGWRLAGQKFFVLAADEADVLLVAARSEMGVSVFVVDANAAGLTRSPLPTTDLIRPLSNVSLAGVEARVIGVRGGGWPLVEVGLRSAVIVLAAEQVGICDHVLRLTVEYARDRRQFGRPIGSFQAVKHRCADMLCTVETARTAALYAAWAASVDDPDTLVAVHLAKAVCSEAADRVTRDAVQVHGGIGFTWEHPLHRYLKRAQGSRLLFGTPAHHRARIASLIGVDGAPSRASG
jgi:alkylation response protein AidB-like acyl-CoA dehydrogenase